MRALVLALILLASPLLAKEPWPRGHVLDLASGEGTWSNSFILTQLDGPWAIFSCNCDYEEYTRIRVALRIATADIRYKGQLLIDSATPYGEEHDRYLHLVRYLKSKKSHTADGFSVTIIYLEALPNQ